MTRRMTKQIIIAVVFFLILFVIGLLIYSLTRPDPTCSDGKQNQSEEEIDCGGPCLSCELSKIKEIEVLSTDAVLNQSDFYDLVAQIKNPNQNYGSNKIPYQFKVYDSSNNLITNYSDSTYILPNQTKYIIQTKIKISRFFDRIELSFGQAEWEKLLDYQAPQLAIQQKEYRLLSAQETGFSQAKGVLVNRSSFDFEQVNIDVLLFDSFNQLVGLNVTEIRTLPSGQERDFFTTWFSQVKGEVALVEMEAETNVFDPDNYLSSGERMPEKFQEY